MLGHLGGQHLGAVVQHPVELQGEVDLGQGVGRELHVDDRTDDGEDAALCEGAFGGAHAGSYGGDRSVVAVGVQFGVAHLLDSASAPPTISEISVVMAA